MQIFFPAVEAHVNTVAAAILSESGMKRLMYIANEMCEIAVRCASHCAVHPVT